MATDWNTLADEFDDDPDHGLRDPAVRAAWAAVLRPAVPTPPATLVDVGCGTGSLAVLLAGDGHRVVGLDSADRMLVRASAKAARAGVAIGLVQGDASAPPPDRWLGRRRAVPARAVGPA